MKEKAKTKCAAAAILLSAFVIWTVLIRLVDVQYVGPLHTKVGFASFNVWFHRFTSVHMTLYIITDWLGLVPIAVCLCFASLGTIQLFRRKSLLKVDADILLLGAYYITVIFCYLFFEMVPLNFRPVLIDGFLEASYPSSTTLLVLSVMPTLRFQVVRRTGNKAVRGLTTGFVILFSVWMVMGRLIAGVHWATDIVGSVLLSFGLISFYQAAVLLSDTRDKNGIQ